MFSNFFEPFCLQNQFNGFLEIWCSSNCVACSFNLGQRALLRAAVFQEDKERAFFSVVVTIVTVVVDVVVESKNRLETILGEWLFRAFFWSHHWTRKWVRLRKFFVVRRKNFDQWLKKTFEKTAENLEINGFGENVVGRNWCHFLSSWIFSFCLP